VADGVGGSRSPPLYDNAFSDVIRLGRSDDEVALRVIAVDSKRTTHDLRSRSSTSSVARRSAANSTEVWGQPRSHFVCKRRALPSGAAPGASADDEARRLEDPESGGETRHEYPRVGPPQSELTLEPTFTRFHP
jgi:hypothetical protein